MRSAKSTDVYEKVKQFQQHTLINKPTFDQMVYEVRLMNFKVRPVSGNIASLDFKNEALIDALWSLGKLDEFCRHEIKSIPTKDQEAFFKLVNEMRFKFQQELSKVRLVHGEVIEEEAPSFEAEIFKDPPSSVN